MTDKAKTSAQLLAELTALQQQVTELETEQQQRDVELERWLAVERESWALAEALNQTGAAIGSSLRGEEVLDRILEEMSRVVACDAACLFLIEGDLARVYRWRGYVRSGRATPMEIVSAALRIDHIPVLRTVRETRRPLAVPHPTNNEEWVHKFGTVWVKSYACAPIRSRGRVIGFLTVDSETPGFFEPADAEALQAFADQATLALENVTLHNRVRREVIKRVKALKKERNFISAILNTANALVVAVNRQGRIVNFNRACELTSGYTFAEVKNRYFWDLLPPETATPAQIYFTELSPDHSSTNSNQLPAKFESYLVTKTGQRRLIAWSNATLFNKGGGVEYFIATGIDITERQQAEEALQHSETTQRAILDAIPDFMFRISRDHTYIPFHTLHQATLLPTDHSEGKKVTEVLPQNLAQQIMGPLEEVFQTGEIQMFEYSLSLPGEIRYYEARLISSGVDEVLCILRDITERQQVEEALRESEQRLELALMGAELGLWDLNVQTGVDIVDQRAAKMLGFTLDEIEPNVKWWDNRTHPDDLPGATEIFEAHVRGETPFYECEYRLLTKSGEWKWILDRGKIVQRDEQGRPVRLAGTHLDLTERKQAEEALRTQNEQLQARNQELAAFARTVAHDLKNPLGALTGIAEILLEDYAQMPPEQLGEYLRSIVQGGRRASRIVEALLLLAGVRQRTVTLEPLDMANIVTESLQRLAQMIEQHQAEIITATTWPAVLGYAPWVEEVWVNYLSNGLKYGGRPPRLELGATVQRNGMVRFWVQDNGLGLTPEAQAQLFTEFTQLEPSRADGYGLGLSIVRRIVEKLGGQVGVESEPGRGSLFSFTLPSVNLPPTSNDQ